MHACLNRKISLPAGFIWLSFAIRLLAGSRKVFRLNIYHIVPYHYINRLEYFLDYVFRYTRESFPLYRVCSYVRTDGRSVNKCRIALLLIIIGYGCTWTRPIMQLSALGININNKDITNKSSAAMTSRDHKDNRPNAKGD